MNERLKRILMATRKKNVATTEPNDNIDHKNVVTIWVRFEDEVKSFP